MCSLRIYFNLFITIKSRLKLQLEYFFNTLIHHVLENKTKKQDIQVSKKIQLEIFNLNPLLSFLIFYL